MGQISPLDQLISNSAFNDCSVTVIYSGVIITDVLLLRDGPLAPLPSLFCADVIVFSGLLQPLFLWCFAFWLFQVLLNARLPRWPDSGTRVTASPDQRDCQASRERRSHIPFPPPVQLQHRLSEPDKKNLLSTCFMLPLCNEISIIYPLLPDVHTCVNVSEYACVKHVHVYSRCMHMKVCTDFLSSSVFLTCWFMLVTALV